MKSKQDVLIFVLGNLLKFHRINIFGMQYPLNENTVKAKDELKKAYKNIIKLLTKFNLFCKQITLIVLT